MDKQRILKEAQKIASKFSFWMVSGNIAHLYGYAYETPDQKYELEIKFDENFPATPPQFIYHDEIKELLGEFQLAGLKKWTPENAVIDIIHDLKAMIQQALNEPIILEEELIPIKEAPEKIPSSPDPMATPASAPISTQENSESAEEYLTPDLNAYPPDLEAQQYITPSQDNMFITDQESPTESSANSPSDQSSPSFTAPTASPPPSDPSSSTPLTEPVSIAINTELGLIQQEYAYDQRGSKKSDINVYLTITLTKTFIIPIDFSDYPELPNIAFPEQVKALLGDPYKTLKTLAKWKAKKAPHIVDVLHELEKKLFFIKDIEQETKKILGEYQCDMVVGSATKLKVHLLTYGFKEYLLVVDLGNYPEPPLVELTPELKEIIQKPLNELDAYKKWEERESEPVEVVREIQWLVDKNSRINFELELLKADYKDIQYDPDAQTLELTMQGKMRTQDLTFEFNIDLPREYPMKLPEVTVMNKFDLESHEKIRQDLQASFNDFFNEWTPFSYLVDLFNLISKKIFEVSIVSCVICHKIECPTCSLKIAGDEACHVDCPYCERSYHKHCWDQTIKSFGKCGFCLKTPPPSMMP